MLVSGAAPCDIAPTREEDVMHGIGYLNARERHPFFLSAAIAINLSAVGAMLAWKAEVFEPRDRGIPIISVAPPIPIAPPKPVDRKTPETRPTDIQRPVDTPLSPIPVPPIDTGRTLWPALPPLAPGGETGNGNATAPTPPAPVEIRASVDPRFASNLQPPYPPWLERQEIAGLVTVRVQVGIDGRVLAVELVSASHPDFFAATRDQALKRWRFKPATRDGVAVTSWVTKTVRFEVRRG
jgi:periplasmic protein TonB